MEAYHNDPVTTPPAEPITDLCVPIVAAAGMAPLELIRLERVA